MDDSAVIALIATTESIEQLIDGTLPLAVDPATLFDVSLNDRSALALETARLAVLLAEPSDVAPEGVDAALWNARTALDHARLTFYRLPTDERAALLDSHAQRQSTDAQTQALRESTEALQRAQLAEAERQRTLAAVEQARSEAERLVVEERARLLGVASRIAERQAAVANSRSELAEHAERTLAFQRRVREVMATTPPAPAVADELYFELRTWLRRSRDELAAALRASPAERVEVRDSDPLATLTIPVDRSEVDQLFDETAATASALNSAEGDNRHARTQQLYGEVQRLNDDRQALLPYLSAAQREAIVGFGSVGLDQALAELRQAGLVLTYHFETVSEWFASGEWPRWDGRLAGVATANLLQVLFVLIVFLWGRRILRATLVDWRQRARDATRRGRRLDGDRLDSAIGTALRVLDPASWLLLVSLVVWVLPPEITELLEFELAEVTLRWSLGGWLAVVTIDQLATQRTRRIRWYRQPRADTARLRSLRLLGIAVVVFGLTLSLSERIVGAGTVYQWVLRTCGWMAVPIGLCIAHWWREVIFERIGHGHQRSTFGTWLLARREGWLGLVAATIGGGYLFVKGVVSVLRAWVGSFELSRRLAAQLFRHQLDRMIDGKGEQALAPLPASADAALSPATPSDALIARIDDSRAADIIRHIDRTGGGVYAVVGERGSGRSTVLRRVSDSRDDVAFVDCPFEGLDSLTEALCRALQLPDGASLEDVAAHLDVRDTDGGIIIGNAHRLIQPVMGGLAAFDRLIDCARRHDTRCAWVISMDRLVWRLLGRARPVTLLFDDVVELEGWGEEDIAALLRNRSKQAGITPNFERLAPELTAEHDEYERATALRYAENSYYRLIWDYAGGNPSVALHTWRTSLGVASDGQVYVTPFKTPEAATFDRLPDSAVFVLRAVLQLERARATDVARATLVSIREVESVLRLGVQKGFLHIDDGLHAVTWHWYGPITRFLQRRHLLASG